MLSTVWSAPNYCYRAGNVASVLEIGPQLERFFNVFGACPDQLRDSPVKDPQSSGDDGSGGKKSKKLVKEQQPNTSIKNQYFI
jgi:hypothetical protein